MSKGAVGFIMGLLVGIAVAATWRAMVDQGLRMERDEARRQAAEAEHKLGVIDEDYRAQQADAEHLRAELMKLKGDAAEKLPATQTQARDCGSG